MDADSARGRRQRGPARPGWIDDRSTFRDHWLRHADLGDRHAG